MYDSFQAVNENTAYTYTYIPVNVYPVVLYIYALYIVIVFMLYGENAAVSWRCGPNRSRITTHFDSRMNRWSVGQLTDEKTKKLAAVI